MIDINKYNQNQILRYYDDLSMEDKTFLENQINKIDFDFMNNLYINSYHDEILDINNISPLKIIKSTNDDNAIKIGKYLVRNNEYAVLLMAGGNASRLGLNIPKGCL